MERLNDPIHQIVLQTEDVTTDTVTYSTRAARRRAVDQLRIDSKVFAVRQNGAGEDRVDLRLFGDRFDVEPRAAA